MGSACAWHCIQFRGNILLQGLPCAEITAAIAQLGERQTEDLKVPGSIPGLGISG